MLRGKSFTLLLTCSVLATLGTACQTKGTGADLDEAMAATPTEAGNGDAVASSAKEEGEATIAPNGDVGNGADQAAAPDQANGDAAVAADAAGNAADKPKGATTSDAEAQLMPVDAGNPKAQLASLSPAAAPAVQAQAESSDGSTRYTLGPLADEDLRNTVYKSLAGGVAGSKSLGGGSEATTELGDEANFSFTIVKLSQGKDDISGDGGYADGMDVEVTGWYKRTLHGDGDTQSACTSFDAMVTISRQGDSWQQTPGAPTSFGREDSEDCY